MNVSSAIFRTYDIRGVVDDVLTPSVVELIGQAFGSEAINKNQQTVAIARDGRLSSPALSEALATGLQAAGCSVIDIGLAPTPVLYFATHFLECGTGIMITGSHNPPEYNGLKMMMAGNTLYGDDIQQLYQRISANDFTRGDGSYVQRNINDEYIQRIVEDARIERPLSIAIDCGNGAAGVIAEKLFQKLGFSPVPLYCEVDGTFPNHHPDPSKTENLEDLRECINKESLELGLAFDGDGDRLGVIDSNGDIIWPDRQMILFARDILERNPGSKIIFDVKCSIHLKNAISEYGGDAMMSKTGHSLIKAKMKETGALLAGEMSGHIFFKERWFGFDDGLYTAVRLLEILSKDSRAPKDVFADLPNSVNTPELNVKFAEGKHYEFMQALQEAAKFDNAEIIDIDGLRAEFSDGWGLVRASNTTPSLVLRFEADNEAALQRIQDVFRKQMLNIDSSLNLPF